MKQYLNIFILNLDPSYHRASFHFSPPANLPFKISIQIFDTSATAMLSWCGFRL